MTSHHHHPHQTDGSVRRLAVVLGLTSVVLVVEVVGAAISGSLALLADAGHMLTDVAGLVLALSAAVLARRPATPERTWGFLRAEVLGAAAQAAVLLAVGVYVIVEACRRLVDPPEVESGAMLVFGIVGLAANLIALAVLAGGRNDNLNLRAAFLEVANDALGSVAVIVAAVSIAAFGWLRADAVVSLLIGALIVPRTWKLLRETVDVLLESTPKGLDLNDVRRHILDVKRVRDVHDLHASQIASGLAVLSAHVVVDDSCFHDGHLPGLLDELQHCVAGHFGVSVEHSTFQFESTQHVDHEQSTHT
jgi:cobalt-zinc-cadmium efflux system protein